MTQIKSINPLYRTQPRKDLRRAIADRMFDPKIIAKKIVPVGLTIATLPLTGCPRENLPPESPSRPVPLTPQTELVQPSNDYEQGRRNAQDNKDVNWCFDQANPAQCIQGYNDQLRAVPRTAPNVSTQQAHDSDIYTVPGSQLSPEGGSRLARLKEKGSQALSLAKEFYRDIAAGTRAQAVDYTAVYRDELNITDPKIINSLEAIRTAKFNQQAVKLAESLNIPVADSGQEIIDTYLNDVRMLKQRGITHEGPYIEFNDQGQNGAWCRTSSKNGHTKCGTQFDTGDESGEAALAVLLAHELNHRRPEFKADGQMTNSQNSKFEEGRNFIVQGFVQESLKQNPRYSAAFQHSDYGSTANQVFSLTDRYQRNFREQNYNGFCLTLNSNPDYGNLPKYDKTDPEQQNPSPLIEQCQ